MMVTSCLDLVSRVVQPAGRGCERLLRGECVAFACSIRAYRSNAARCRLSACARDTYHAMPTSAARTRTATSPRAFEGEWVPDKNQNQPTNPKIDNRAVRRTAEWASGDRQKRAIAEVFMCHLAGTSPRVHSGPWRISTAA